MNEVDMDKTMERARCAIEKHLEDLMDEVDRNGGRISSRSILGGIHETLESLALFDGNKAADTGKPAAR